MTTTPTPAIAPSDEPTRRPRQPDDRRRRDHRAATTGPSIASCASTPTPSTSPPSSPAQDAAGADGPRPDRLPAPDEHRPRRPGHGPRRLRGAHRGRRRTTVSRPTPRPSAPGWAATGPARPPPRRPADPLADRPAGADARAPARLLPRRRPEPARPSDRARCASSARPSPRPVRARHGGVRARGGRPLRPGPRRRARRRRRQPRRRVGDPRRRPHLRDAGHASTTASRFLTSRPHAVGGGQPVHRPQLVAPRALPAGGRPARAGAGDLRRRDPPRRFARRADRDARRQRAAVADAARRHRHRRPLRPARRRVGAEGRRPSRGTCSTTCTPRWRSSAPAGWPRRTRVIDRLDRWLDTAAGHERPHDGRDRPAGVPRRGRLRRGSPRRRDRRAAADPPRAASTSAARTPSATRCSARCSSRRCAAGRYELARALTAERLGVRETSVYGWTQRARALRGLGETAGAEADEPPPPPTAPASPPAS